MFVEVGARVRVEDLLRGIIIQSGNDACIVIAEALGRHRGRIRREMTERAPRARPDHPILKNASGWPDPGHLMSVRDLATLAQHHDPAVPRVLPIFSREGVHLQRHPAVLAQPAALPGPGRRRPEDRPHRGSGLWPGRLGGARRPAPDAGAGGARAAGPARRARPSGCSSTASASSRTTGCSRPARPSSRPTSGSATTAACRWCSRRTWWSRSPPRPPRARVRVAYDGPIPAPVVERRAARRARDRGARDRAARRLPLVAGQEVHAASLLGRVTSALGYLIWGPS